MKLIKIVLLILVALAIFFFSTSKYSPIVRTKAHDFQPDNFYEKSSPVLRRKIFEKWKPANKLEELQLPGHP